MVNLLIIIQCPYYTAAWIPNTQRILLLLTPTCHNNSDMPGNYFLGDRKFGFTGFVVVKQRYHFLRS
jgi:hypothetical protein